jgi:uncharacterized protein (DUF1684 family)
MTIAPAKEFLKQSEFEQLLDYRRSVANIYADLRRSDLSDEETCRRFRAQRDHLFASHPQSALSEVQRANFKALPYYPYDPKWRLVLPVNTKVEQETIKVELQGDGLVRMQRFGQIEFEVAGRAVSLSLFWVLGYGGGIFLQGLINAIIVFKKFWVLDYGGGIFLPFRDLTNEETTYGGGRYLLDTIKHADLGHEDNRLVIDFNYAYNPSCAYNPRWHCPLAPRENWLPVAISAGEQRYPD